MVHFIQNRQQLMLTGELQHDNTMDLLAGLQHHLSSGHEAAEILVASGGGRLNPTLCLVNMIEALSQNFIVRTIGTGLVASAAVAVLVAGSRGERYLLSNGSILLHEGSYTFGEKVTKTTTEWEDWIRQQRFDDDRYLSVLARHSRLSQDEWREKIERKGDVTFSPKEAQDLGLIDHIVDALPVPFACLPQPEPEKKRKGIFGKRS
jgi:ATP-dependent protease ClpP protease subunit